VESLLKQACNEKTDIAGKLKTYPKSTKIVTRDAWGIKYNEKIAFTCKMMFGDEVKKVMTCNFDELAKVFSCNNDKQRELINVFRNYNEVRKYLFADPLKISSRDITIR